MGSGKERRETIKEYFFSQYEKDPPPERGGKRELRRFVKRITKGRFEEKYDFYRERGEQLTWGRRAHSRRKKPSIKWGTCPLRKPGLADLHDAPRRGKNDLFLMGGRKGLGFKPSKRKEHGIPGWTFCGLPYQRGEGKW